MRKLVSASVLVVLVLAITAWASDASTVNGWVVDEKCGAKGAHAGAEDCAKKCIGAGEKMVVVTDQDKQLLYVENPEALKEQIGKHVAIQGTVTGNKLHVNSAEIAAAEPAQK